MAKEPEDDEDGADRETATNGTTTTTAQRHKHSLKAATMNKQKKGHIELKEPTLK